MERKYQLPFKVGQSAEARSFEVGFRGAWFRCKIKELNRKKGHLSALLEYFDYPDEKCTWLRLYQVASYQSDKSKETLMLRPHYPPIDHESRVSDYVGSNSDVTVVVDGTWKVGDLVDWWTQGCYWSGKLTQFLGDSKAKIELVSPPLGEGEIYEVFVKDLRPTLKWSPHFGWAVPTSLHGGSCRQCAQLLQPTSQAYYDVPITEEHAVFEGRRGTQTTESSSNISGNSLPHERRESKSKTSVKHPSAANGSKDASDQTTSSTRISAKPLPPVLAEKSGSKAKRLMEQPSDTAHYSAKEIILCDSNSGSLVGDDAARVRDKDPYPLKEFRNSGRIRLNSLESDSMEAAIMDLEELVNKISWLKGIMGCGNPVSDAVKPSWQFVEHRGTAIRK